MRKSFIQLPGSWSGEDKIKNIERIDNIGGYDGKSV